MGSQGMRFWRYGLLFSIVLALLVSGEFVLRGWRQSQEASYERQCREARGAERWADLQRLGEQWVGWNRRSADAWLFRADAAQHLGDFASAATFLESIPESDPKALPAFVGLATLQFGTLNRPFDGVRTCERILKIEPRTTVAHQQLIEFYAMSLQRRQLDYHIRFAIECSREPPAAYVYLFLMDTMRLATGVESNERWLTQDPDSELFLVARVLQMPEPENGIKDRNGSDKYTLADSLLQRFPKNLELLAYQLDLSVKRGNVEDVIKILKRLPAEADGDCRFWRAKGWLHLSRDEIGKAKQALQQAIDLYPQDWHARNLLADALRREGKLVEAEPLHELVQYSRRLRERITSTGSSQDVPTEVLADLANFARQCGDTLVADALNRRLRRN